MKIKATLAPLAGFTLVGFLWVGEATAQRDRGAGGGSFRRPSLRRLCQSAESQSLDEPPKWRRRKHAAPGPPTGRRRWRDAATRRYAWRCAAAGRGTRRRNPTPERTTRRRNAAAGRSSRWCPATWRRPGRDPAPRRRGGIAAPRRRAWQSAAGRGERKPAPWRRRWDPAAGGRRWRQPAPWRRRWRQPAAGGRGRGEPARRVVRPPFRLPRNARPRRAPTGRSTPWYTSERTAESRRSAQQRRQSAQHRRSEYWQPQYWRSE